MLSTSKALQLYNLLSKHIPSDTKDVDVFGLVDKIVNSIVEKNEPNVYSDAIMIMHGIDSVYLLKDESSTELLKMFADGLVENDIVSLVGFFGKVKQHGIS